MAGSLLSWLVHSTLVPAGTTFRTAIPREFALNHESTKPEQTFKASHRAEASIAPADRSSHERRPGGNSRTEADQNTHNSVWPDASLFGVALIWGINIPIMKIGLDQVDAYVFNAVRLVISACVLAGFALRERRQGVRPKSGLRFRALVTYALVVSGLYQLLFLLGIARTTSGNTALIISTVPMWTSLMARVFLAEKLKRLAWCGLLTALSGTIIVALQKGDVSAGSEHLLGNAFVLGAALAWSGGTVYSRPLLTLISPMQLSAIAAVMALPLHLLFATGRYQSSLTALQSIDVWAIIFYSGVLSTGLALPMWNYGVRHAGAAHASVIQNLIPLIAIAAAWISRGETASTAQVFGGALILSGLIIMRISRESAEPKTTANNKNMPANPVAAPVGTGENNQ